MRPSSSSVRLAVPPAEEAAEAAPRAKPSAGERAPVPGGAGRRRLRILYHHRTGSRDGQAVHIEELTRALAGRGHQLEIVGPRATERQSFGAEASLFARTRAVLPRAVGELLELAYAVAAYRRLDAAWRRFRPDVVYERYNLFLPAGVWLRERRGTPLMLEVNSPLLHERQRFGGLRLRRLARWSERRAWRGADVVLPVTEVLADLVRAEGVQPDRVRVVANGVDLARFRVPPPPAAARRALGLDDGPTVGFTGFVRDWHRLDRVLAWLADGARGARLLVVGDGPARPALEARARELGVGDRVRFTGVVPRERVADWIAAFDVALQPAVTPYASPLKLFEYMALARPIVAPDLPNLREVLRPGANALLFDEGDDGALARALDRLLADPELAARLGAQARRTLVERRLTWEGNAERVEQAAWDLVDRAAAVPARSPTA